MSIYLGRLVLRIIHSVNVLGARSPKAIWISIFSHFIYDVNKLGLQMQNKCLYYGISRIFLYHKVDCELFLSAQTLNISSCNGCTLKIDMSTTYHKFWKIDSVFMEVAVAHFTLLLMIKKHLHTKKTTTPWNRTIKWKYIVKVVKLVHIVGNYRQTQTCHFTSSQFFSVNCNSKALVE